MGGTIGACCHHPGYRRCCWDQAGCTGGGDSEVDSSGIFQRWNQQDVLTY